MRIHYLCTISFGSSLHPAKEKLDFLNPAKLSSSGLISVTTFVPILFGNRLIVGGIIQVSNIDGTPLSVSLRTFLRASLRVSWGTSLGTSLKIPLRISPLMLLVGTFIIIVTIFPTVPANTVVGTCLYLPFHGLNGLYCFL